MDQDQGPRVTGIGGIFFKARDPEALRAWYRRHLGLDIQDWGGTTFRWHDASAPEPEGATVWSIFPSDSNYFAPSPAPFMINYRVRNLALVLEALRAEGCTVDERMETSEFGRFGWVMDPEGNRIELWEPPPGRFPGEVIMKALLIFWIACIWIAFIAAPPPVAAGDSNPLARLGWLAGCWAEALPDGLREEQWMAPRGKTMLGMSRTVVGGKTVEYEHLRIEEQDGVLVYTASPSGQATTSFRQVELTDSTAVFADPGHDFPERIRYRRLTAGSLLAQIEGVRNGVTRVIDFPFARRPCE